MLQLWWQSFPSQLQGMVGRPEKAEELRKRVAWCPSSILDRDQDSASEGAAVGQQNFDDVLDMKSQNKEKQWAKN